MKEIYSKDAEELLTEMELFEVKGGVEKRPDTNPVIECVAICTACVGCESSCAVCTKCVACTYITML